MQEEIEVAQSSLIGSIMIYSLPVWPTLSFHMVAFSSHMWHCVASWNLLLDGRLRQREHRTRRFRDENYGFSDDGLVHISDSTDNHIVHTAGGRLLKEASRT